MSDSYDVKVEEVLRCYPARNGVANVAGISVRIVFPDSTIGALENIYGDLHKDYFVVTNGLGDALDQLAKTTMLNFNLYSKPRAVSATCLAIYNHVNTLLDSKGSE